MAEIGRLLILYGLTAIDSAFTRFLGSHEEHHQPKAQTVATGGRMLGCATGSLMESASRTRDGSYQPLRLGGTSVGLVRHRAVRMARPKCPIGFYCLFSTRLPQREGLDPFKLSSGEESTESELPDGQSARRPLLSHLRV